LPHILFGSTNIQHNTIFSLLNQEKLYRNQNGEEKQPVRIFTREKEKLAILQIQKAQSPRSTVPRQEQPIKSIRKRTDYSLKDETGNKGFSLE